jgi:hypothetical protein
MPPDIHSQNLKIILKDKLFRIKNNDLVSLRENKDFRDYDAYGISYKHPYEMLDAIYDHTFEITEEELFLEFYNKFNLDLLPC